MKQNGKKTAVIDYGAGNLRSVANALERIGTSYFVATAPEELRKASSIILPGVGAFGYAMHSLERSGFASALKEAAKSGVPLMGICLGMQLLFSSSEESEGVAGLGILRGKATRLKVEDFSTALEMTNKACETANKACEATKDECVPTKEKLKIPHMGWTDLYGCKGRLMNGVHDGDFVYFVHSFGVHSEGCDATFARYGEEFDAAVECGNVCATQFHPEKSSAVGEHILANFLKMQD